MPKRNMWAPVARVGGMLAVAATLEIAVLCPARPAAAQQPSVGLGLGLVDMPRNLGPCRFGSRIDGLGADLRAAVPLSERWSAEARVGGNLNFDVPECVEISRPRPDGQYVRLEYPGKEEGYSSDVRLRFQATREVVLAAGAGWFWGPHAPYLAVSPGLRLGRRVRFLLDADGALGRFPHDLITEFWQSGLLVDQSEPRTVREWHAVVDVRAGVELRLGHPR